MENAMVPKDARDEIEAIRSDAETLFAKAREVSRIADLEQEARAVEFLAQVKLRQRMMEAKRLQYTAPLNAALKAINADFKAVLGPLDEAESLVKYGIAGFRDAEDFRLKEEARKLAESEAKSAMRAVENIPTDEGVARAQAAIAKMEEKEALAPRTVSTQSGQLRTRKVWRYDVTDAEAIPREYLCPDDKAIKEAMKSGVREIPGIRVYEETVPIIVS